MCCKYHDSGGVERPSETKWQQYVCPYDRKNCCLSKCGLPVEDVEMLDNRPERTHMLPLHGCTLFLQKTDSRTKYPFSGSLRKDKPSTSDDQTITYGPVKPFHK